VMIPLSRITILTQFEVNTWLNNHETDCLILIVDSDVWSLYEDDFMLTNMGKTCLVWRALPGEDSKSLSHYTECCDFLLSNGIHRNAHVVGIGGGATTDFAGFVASTLLRGLSWTAIPTSLLGMVDAAIGGKTALNSISGKNLIGTIHVPTQILINPSYLSSLSRTEYLSGMGEVVKYCFLSRSIFDAVHAREPLESIIELCARHKETVVERDLHDRGGRRFLNLGHTFGHAFERCFGLSHGIAVTLGLQLIINEFAANSELVGRYAEVAKALGLEHTDALYTAYMSKMSADDEAKSRFFQFVSKDKKRTSNTAIDIVRIECIGEPFVESVALSELLHHVSQRIELYRV
jgi:3-dehydroquinate synthase